MSRWIRHSIVGVAALVAMAPVTAYAQYGTTTTTSTSTTTAAPGVTVPTLPTVTVPPTIPVEVAGEVQNALEGLVDDIDALLDDFGFDLDEDVDLDDLSDEEREELISEIGDILAGIADLFGGGDDAESAARLAVLNSDDPEFEELKAELALRLSKLIEILLALDGAEGEDLEALGDQLDAFAEGDVDGPVVVSLSVSGREGLVFFILESDPTLLGAVQADEDGNAEFDAEVTDDLEPGTHTITAIGTNEDGDPVVSQIEFEVGEPETERAIPAPSDTEQAAATSTSDSGSSLPFVLLGGAAGVLLLGFAIRLNRRARAASSASRSS